MNKVLIVVIILGLLALGVWVVSKNYLQAPSMNTMQTQSNSQAQTPVTPNTINISNFSFQPGTMKVKVGTTVTWVNMDSTIHKIKSDTFNSQNLNQGDKYSFTFNTKGSFPYSCAIHPSMTGTIVVE